MADAVTSAAPGEIPPAAAPVDGQTALYGETKPEAKVEAQPEVKPEEKTETVLTETKPETKPEGEVKSEEKPAAFKAEDYKIKLPDGFVENPALISEFQKTAAEVGLPPDGAQKLVDLYAKAASDQIKELETSGALATPAVQAKWIESINAMPEFQGERRNASLQIIGRVMEEFGSSELRKMLETSGFGNNPEMAKFVLTMAEVLTEGSITPAGRPSPLNGGKPRGKTGGEILYGQPPSGA